jgi:3-phenylpropionate/trans-cinnamate dioxygenase ferredoxin reductase subunit
MDETAWKRAARESDLVEGVPLLVKAGDEEVLLVRFEGQVRAFGHECPHHHDPLEKGALVGGELVCPGHYARFSARDGTMTAPPSLDDLPVHPVRVESGEVWVGPAARPKRPVVGEGDPRTFLLVGAGAAGSAAAETLRREGFAGRIVMVTPEPDAPYDRPELSKGFLTGKTLPEWLPLRGPKFYASRRIEVWTGRRVTGLDPRRKVALLDGDESFAFDKALLATGGSPRPLPIPGADGCITLRSLSDARALSEAASRAGSVVVIGAGFIGMEVASSLRDRGLRVDVVTPDALPLSRIFDEQTARLLLRRQQEKGVTFHLGRTPTRVGGQPGARTVVLSDGTSLAADLLVVGIGVAPAVEYLAGTGLAQAGGVPVDARLATAHPDIFAAGDIAIVPSFDGGEPERIEHWAVAQRQGRHAARAMLGHTAPFAEVPFFWTKQAGVSLKVAGSTRGYDEVAVRGDVEAGKFLAGFFRRGALRALLTAGMVRDHIVAERALAAGRGPTARQLADGSFDLRSLV